MSRTKRMAFTRRRMLTGFGGVVVGLPFLEALAPRVARGQSAPTTKRFGVFFCCNGVNMERWFPAGDYGPLSAQMLEGTANEALSPLSSKLLFPRGIHMSPRGFQHDTPPPGTGGDDHGKGMAHKLTAQFADEDDWLALGPSIDHVLAAQINPGEPGARRPPLNLMAGRTSGYRGLDYISYRGARQPVQAINNPWNAYSELIRLNGAGEGAPDSAEAAARISLRRQSVLDLVRDQFEDLKRAGLSLDDQRKLDAHFTTVRSIEVQASQGSFSCNDPVLLQAVSQFEGSDRVQQDSAYPSVADLQVDIMALALACDFTRVATMQFDRGAGGPIFTWDGMQHQYNHHALSHGKNDGGCFDNNSGAQCRDVEGYQQMLFDIDVWHQNRFVRLLSRLDSYKEAEERSVLDNSVILYTNELTDGREHNYLDQPYILAGSAGGYFKQGEYVAIGNPSQPRDWEAAPHNRLLNTLVNAMGIESDWFGVAEGEGGTTMQRGIYEALLA